MLDLIVRLVPVSLGGFIVVFIAFEVAISLAAIGLTLLFFDVGWADLQLTALTALIVSGPMVWIMLASLRHQKRLQADLIRLATTDMLTGLPNRRAFLEIVAPNGVVARQGALVLADVDHFKRINDTHGHDVGDVCLRAIAERFHAIRRDGDMVARYGGEEFALFCAGADEDRLLSLEPVLCGPHDVTCDLIGQRLSISLSAGSVITPAGASSIEVYRNADQALYRAKASGRGRLIIAEPPGSVPPPD